MKNDNKLKKYCYISQETKTVDLLEAYLIIEKASAINDFFVVNRILSIVSKALEMNKNNNTITENVEIPKGLLMKY